MNKAKHRSTGGEYAIGYRRPPPQHQFKKGQSGNLRGRPKKRRNPENWEDIFLRVAGEMIPANKNGRPIMITKWQALVERVFNEGASDAKARDLALQFLPYVGNGDGGVIYQEVDEKLLRI
jgi:hypothetical protein